MFENLKRILFQTCKVNLSQILSLAIGWSSF